ncbi:hypothetical protein ACH4ZX_26450 [Streptomyces sp. NPDC020490]|uniref:hypothetical protein n=1 Tax=Streptomyces sp. NPDC020490 TaxID=3365078 RepID=UPI0037BAA4DF
MLTTRRASGRQVITLDVVVDIANAGEVGRELTELVRRCPEPCVVVDVRTPIVTAAGVSMLELVRAEAVYRGKALRVVVHHRLAHQVMRIAGVERLLDVRPGPREAPQGSG